MQNIFVFLWFCSIISLTRTFSCLIIGHWMTLDTRTIYNPLKSTGQKLAKNAGFPARFARKPTQSYQLFWRKVTKNGFWVVYDSMTWDGMAEVRGKGPLHAADRAEKDACFSLLPTQKLVDIPVSNKINACWTQLIVVSVKLGRPPEIIWANLQDALCTWRVNQWFPVDFPPTQWHDEVSTHILWLKTGTPHHGSSVSHWYSRFQWMRCVQS
jgi:hypothetical protein